MLEVEQHGNVIGVSGLETESLGNIRGKTCEKCETTEAVSLRGLSWLCVMNLICRQQSRGDVWWMHFPTPPSYPSALPATISRPQHRLSYLFSHPPALKSSLLLPGRHPGPVLSVLSNISLANTQRWSLNKGAYAAGARLSTTLMTSMFRAAPEESHKLHFSPTRALSTPFLMHSSNPSESYHAALPRSLNKSFPPLPPSRRLPLVPRSGSSSSSRLLLLPRYLRCRLCPTLLLVLLSAASNSPVCNYLMCRCSVSFFNASFSSARLNFNPWLTLTLCEHFSSASTGPACVQRHSFTQLPYTRTHGVGKYMSFPSQQTLISVRRCRDQTKPCLQAAANLSAGETQ